MLVFATLRRYLQAMGRVGPILFALIVANGVNGLANWILVFGHLGAPALGVEGSGWATTLARGVLALMLIGSVIRHEWRHPTGLRRASLRPDPARIGRLVGLGFPAAVQVTLEVGVFALATTLVGRLGPIPLAAHQIVLNVASLTFMIPLGLASAAAVRVGHALGRGEPESAAHAGWTAILLGAGFMTISGLTFLLLPEAIMGRFTTDPAVVATGLSLLGIAACFQLFDGLQGVTTGALRGVGDTRTPMLCNLLAHWCLGLPVGTALAFVGGWGVLGLWVGLSLGLTAAGIILLRVWVLKARAMTVGGPLNDLGRPDKETT